MKYIFSFLFFILLLSGCGNSETTVQATTATPDTDTGDQITSPINVRLYINSTTVYAGDQITLSTDIDESISAYQWQDENGELLSTSNTATWTAPVTEGNYTLTLTIFDFNNTPNSTSLNMTVIAVDNSPFKEIHALINQADQGTAANVTYLCIGDSTRAENDKYNGQYLFYELKNTLNGYNVTSHLLARAGHEAQQFNDETAYPTWRDTVNLIPGEGETSIVDICLGINDYWYLAPDTIKTNLRSAIAKIQNVKPQTHFILTMPDRVYGNEEMTDFLKSVYIELSNELDIPLNNVVDDLMPTQEETSYSWYRDDGFNVHLSEEGQHLIAQYILGNILPN